MAVTCALNDFSAKTLNLVSGYLAEVSIQRITRFQLSAIDQQSARPRVRVAILVKVAKQLKTSVFKRCRAIFVFPFKAGNIVVNQLGSRSIVTNHNKARRHIDTSLLHKREGLFVVPVQSLQCCLQLYGQVQRIEISGPAPSSPGHAGADVFPEIAELRHIATGDIVRHRYPGQFDNAAFDGIHKRKIAHRPGEQCSFAITRPLQKERRCGEIHHPVNTELFTHCFNPGNPQPRSFRILLGFLPVIACQLALFCLARLLAIAVVRLIIENHDILHAHEFGHHPLQHLPLGLQSCERITSSLKQGTPTSG